MRPKPKYFDMGELEPKLFSCFICSNRSKEKGISLLLAQTAFSRISLGEKLQEILGAKYVVLLTTKDSICWDCATSINWVDRSEHKLDLVKEHIVNQVTSRYRKVEVSLNEKVETVEENLETVPNKISASAHIPQQGIEEVKEEQPLPTPKPRKKKEFTCKYCGKDYVSLMSLSMHIQRIHGGKEVCEECGARFETVYQLKRHLKTHLPSDKELTCVSCGFHTTNTEVYCRHVCNSSIVSLTCITCNKRYVDSNFQQENGSSYQCQSCAAEEGSKLQQEQSPQEETTASELAAEMPEFFKEPDSNEEDPLSMQNEEGRVSYLRCEGCEEQFLLGDLTKHLCFIRGDTVEFVEVEAPVPGKKVQPTNFPLYCKDCGAQFTNIESLRNHWDHTGHTRQVSTIAVETNKIRDKFKKTETTFKVVKQNFNIRATIPGQNDEILRSADDYKDMFVKITENDTIEDFLRKEGKECETCGIVFATEEMLAGHQQKDCLTCVTCSISFYDNKLLRRHYQYTGHARKVIHPTKFTYASKGPLGYRCHRCVKTFRTRFLLKKHFQVHYRGTQKGACQFCLQEFENKNDIQQHVLEIHGAHLYKCSQCECTFMSEAFRIRHEAKHKTAIECQTCNLKFVSQKSLLLHNETYHQADHNGACRLCGKVVEDPVSLRKHERRHYFEKGLDCDICKKRFRSKALLISHLKVHGDEVKFRCDRCELGFATEDALKEHKFSHLKSGKFKCPRCNAIFASKAHFWMHTKTHEACYVCSVCNRSFRDTSLLAVHRKKHWRVRPYQCPRCPRTFSVPATLRRHLHIHTRVYPHKCGLCKRGFLTRHAYHRHTETVHGVSHSFPQRRPNIPSLPLNATDEDIFQAADTLIADDSLIFNDYQNKEIEQVSSGGDLITNEVVVETTELFDEILH